MEYFEWIVIGLLFAIAYQLSKLHQKVDYLQQDHIDMSQKLFPHDWEPEDEG